MTEGKPTADLMLIVRLWINVEKELNKAISVHVYFSVSYRAHELCCFNIIWLDKVWHWLILAVIWWWESTTNMLMTKQCDLEWCLLLEYFKASWQVVIDFVMCEHSSQIFVKAQRSRELKIEQRMFKPSTLPQTLQAIHHSSAAQTREERLHQGKGIQTYSTTQHTRQKTESSDCRENRLCCWEIPASVKSTLWRQKENVNQACTSWTGQADHSSLE